MGFFDGQKINEKFDRVPKPQPGRHLIIIEALEVAKTREYGECPKIKGRIKQSATEEAGKAVGDMFFLHTGSEMTKGYTRGEFLNFGRALQTCLEGTGDTAQITEIDNLLASLYYHPQYIQSQPARGLAMYVDSEFATKDGKQVINKAGQPVINLTFHGFAQTSEDIHSQRAWIEEYMSATASVAQTAHAVAQATHPNIPGSSLPQPPPFGAVVPAAVTAPQPAPVPMPPAPSAIPSAPVPALTAPPAPPVAAPVPAQAQPSYTPPVGKQSVLDKLGIG